MEEPDVDEVPATDPAASSSAMGATLAADELAVVEPAGVKPACPETA